MPGLQTNSSSLGSPHRLYHSDEFEIGHCSQQVVATTDASYGVINRTLIVTKRDFAHPPQAKSVKTAMPTSEPGYDHVGHKGPGIREGLPATSSRMSQDVLGYPGMLWDTKDLGSGRVCLLQPVGCPRMSWVIPGCFGTRRTWDQGEFACYNQ